MISTLSTELAIRHWAFARGFGSTAVSLCAVAFLRFVLAHGTMMMTVLVGLVAVTANSAPGLLGLSTLKVVLTSFGHQNDRLKSYHPGRNSYLVKPIYFEQFSAPVRKLGVYGVVLPHPPQLES